MCFDSAMPVGKSTMLVLSLGRIVATHLLSFYPCIGCNVRPGL